MLPVRLGMLNAHGPQDLVLYVLTPKGRVETTNYRTIKLPANVDIPTFVRGEFAPDLQGDLRRAGGARGLSRDLHRVLLGHELVRSVRRRPAVAGRAAAGRRVLGECAPGGAQPVMLTRLHLRYTRDTLPEDLMFQETADRQNFQVRYVLHHPWTGDESACAEAKAYFDAVQAREEREAQTLATLTGGDVNAIRARMSLAPQKNQWWETLWPAPKP